MLKFGICKVSQDTPVQRLWRRGLLSASLLRLSTSPTPAEIARFERLMPQLCLSNGVVRTTGRERLRELDDALQSLLRGLFPEASPLVVEDWAVSSGVTAGEWYRRLLADYRALQFTASDWTLCLIEAYRNQSGDTYILEPDGTPIQYIRPPFVVNLVRQSHWVYPVNRRLRVQALREWQEKLAGQLHIPPEWDGLNGPREAIPAPPFLLRGLPLVHPDVLNLRDDRFKLKRHSIFTPLKEPVDVVRTMNILNRAYFDDAQLREAVSTVDRSLKPDGLWIVGRTVQDHPPRHEVSVFRKLDHGWQIALRIGGGSEMEPVVNPS